VSTSLLMVELVPVMSCVPFYLSGDSIYSQQTTVC
jgi:hypothetical protein